MTSSLYTKEEVVDLVRRAAMRLVGRVPNAALPHLELFIIFLKEELDGVWKIPKASASVPTPSGDPAATPAPCKRRHWPWSRSARL